MQGDSAVGQDPFVPRGPVGPGMGVRRAGRLPHHAVRLEDRVGRRRIARRERVMVASHRLGGPLGQVVVREHAVANLVCPVQRPRAVIDTQVADTASVDLRDQHDGQLAFVPVELEPQGDLVNDAPGGLGRANVLDARFMGVEPRAGLGDELRRKLLAAERGVHRGALAERAEHTDISRDQAWVELTNGLSRGHGRPLRRTDVMSGLFPNRALPRCRSAMTSGSNRP